jgi:hypothetical protein
LYLLYFTSISILYGPGPSADGCSAAAILASSCVARTLEDFLARDKLRYLIPTVPYYLLVAGLSQLACYRFPALLELTKSELNIIRSSLLELGKIWHSAREKLHILDRFLAIANSGSGSGAHADPVKHLDISREQLSYFEMFPPELCPKWEIIVSGNYAEQPQSFSQDTLVGPIIGNEGWAALVPENQLPLETTISTTGAATRRPDRQLNLTTNGLRGSEVDWVFPDIDGRWEDFNDMLESSAGWLLQGWETNIV